MTLTDELLHVPDTKKNEARCICPGCPTHNSCMKDKGERLFCARGKSSCTIERSGCICGECQVKAGYRFPRLYFCDTGAARW